MDDRRLLALLICAVIALAGLTAWVWRASVKTRAAPAMRSARSEATWNSASPPVRTS